jgi:hypothetical protein
VFGENLEDRIIVMALGLLRLGAQMNLASASLRDVFFLRGKKMKSESTGSLPLQKYFQLFLYLLFL